MSEPKPAGTTVSAEVEATYGPAMSALSAMQRKFVYAMLANPKGHASGWATAAGYSTKGRGHAVQAHRNLHDERVRAAIFEVARNTLDARGPMLAAEALLRIAADESHDDHFKAVLAVADRVGLHATTEHRVTVEHTMNEARMMEIAGRMAAEFGISAAGLIGPNMVTPKLIESTATELESLAPEQPGQD